jgi:hypothetical protein
MHRVQTMPDDQLDESLRAAIAERRVITFSLDGLRRVAEPHDYGVIDGERKLFFYQIGGQSRSGKPVGWRWALLSKVSDLQFLDRHFAGSRPAPSGRHVQWDQLFATVSARSTTEMSTTK